MRSSLDIRNQSATNRTIASRTRLRLLACGGLLAATCWVRAAYPPQDPAASLDLLLRDVWAQGSDKAYTLYMGKSAVPMAPAARQSFAADMLELAKTSHLTGISIQGNNPRSYRKNDLPSAEVINTAGFIHFLRPAPKGDQITERIYLNVHPDHAAEVMRFVVVELMQPKSSRRPGEPASPATPVERKIPETKIAGPSGLVNRADSILIYACSLADVEWALACLADYQAAHPGHFLPDLPAATHPRLTGVGTAAEPAASLKGGSFGAYLSGVAEKALHTKPAPADFVAFRTSVRQIMRDDGVDPDHPDRLTRRP